MPRDRPSGTSSPYRAEACMADACPLRSASRNCKFYLAFQKRNQESSPPECGVDGRLIMIIAVIVGSPAVSCTDQRAA